MRRVKPVETMPFDLDPTQGGYGTVETFIDSLEEAKHMLTLADVALYAAGVRSDEVDDAINVIREAMNDRIFEFREVADDSEIQL